MTQAVSTLYTTDHFSLSDTIASSLERGIRQSVNRPLVFFRADDIGIPSQRFSQMISCFQDHRLPLCLATVPAWLNTSRLQQLRRLTGTNSGQWCWHQHGRLHRNFEPSGKKQEFGPARSRKEIQASLGKGRARLEQLLDLDFQPVFTPPWNRCGGDTLQALGALGFKAVSRSKGAQPETLPELPDFQVNVDLHTRKEADPHLGLKNLATEIEQGFASGLCGIMIHHQRMNKAALELLDILLGLIKNNARLLPVHFNDLLEK